jgi:hypothetical protein
MNLEREKSPQFLKHHPLPPVFRPILRDCLHFIPRKNSTKRARIFRAPQSKQNRISSLPTQKAQFHSFRETVKTALLPAQTKRTAPPMLYDVSHRSR